MEMDYFSILAVIGSVVSIPTLVTAIILRKITKKLDKRDKAAEKVRDDRVEYDILYMDRMDSIGKVARASAIAVRDGKCNGIMEDALRHDEETSEKVLQYRKRVEAEYRCKTAD